jgi:acetyl esterase/lipase
MDMRLGLRRPDVAGETSWDFFAPEGGEDRPLIVFIHGGGWISGDRTMYRDEAPWWVEQGFACACIDYRLAPLYRFPHPIASVQMFFAYARTDEFAAQAGMKPRQVLAMGNSAGGHLALMSALAPNVLGQDQPAVRCDAAVALCPITDLRSPEADGFDMSVSYIEELMGGPLPGKDAELAAASPILYAAEPGAPVLMICGDSDVIVPHEQTLRMHEALPGSRAQVLAGEGHTFSYPGWIKIRQEALAFFQELA